MSRILLLLSSPENERLLAEELAQSHDVQIARDDDAIDQSFDLCVLDGRSLDRLWERVQERKRREQPTFLPILLVTSRPDVKMITRQIWQNVDELIVSPIEKPELRARIEILLRVRSLSVSLQQQADEARHAEAKARVASQAKSEFLANMSHELRTPINAVTGYTDLLELGLAGPLNDQQIAHLSRIKFSTNHLLSLVNEVLNVAKVESGQFDVEPENVSLVDTVREALDLLGPVDRAKDIELHNGVVENAGTSYWGDPDRVRQILVNLLSNAIRFTEAGGRVSIACRNSDASEPGSQASGPGPWVVVDVEDSGIGIPAHNLASIFEPFVQVDGSRTRRHDGTGLGLTISRRLARMMGGDLTVASEVGAGTRFSLWLPASPSESDAVTATRVTIEVQRLSEVGRALARCAGEIVSDLVKRLVTEPAFGPYQTSPLQLEDHIATFLADIGLALVALDDGPGDPSLLRDGTEIQRLLSRLHGAQRRRIGWPAEMVQREYGLLREIVAAKLRQTLPESAGGTVDEALEIVQRLLHRAERVSLRGWELAGPDAG